MVISRESWKKLIGSWLLQTIIAWDPIFFNDLFLLGSVTDPAHSCESYHRSCDSDSSHVHKLCGNDGTPDCMNKNSGP